MFQLIDGNFRGPISTKKRTLIIIPLQGIFHLENSLEWNNLSKKLNKILKQSISFEALRIQCFIVLKFHEYIQISFKKIKSKKCNYGRFDFFLSKNLTSKKKVLLFNNLIFEYQIVEKQDFFLEYIQAFYQKNHRQ